MTYFGIRLLQVIPTFVGVLTVIFIILRVLPGDPATMMLATEGMASREAVLALRERLGLNEPIIQQYGRFLWMALQGDFGRSLFTGRSVFAETANVLPYTIELMIAGVLISILLGIPLGVLSAVYANTIIDRYSRTVALLGIAAPEFWTGLLLLLFFSVYLGWFPIIGGATSGAESLLERLKLLVLPGLTVGFRLIALTSRLTRSCMLEVLGQDYIRTAKAKGLRTNLIVWKHALRNALMPIVTVIGLNVGHLLGGAIAVEVVFARPGIGKLLMDSILLRDYTQVQGTMAIFTGMVILVNLSVDLLYSRLDPRVTLGAAK